MAWKSFISIEFESNFISNFIYSWSNSFIKRTFTPLHSIFISFEYWKWSFPSGHLSSIEYKSMHWSPPFSSSRKFFHSINKWKSFEMIWKILKRFYPLEIYFFKTMSHWKRLHRNFKSIEFLIDGFHHYHQQENPFLSFNLFIVRFHSFSSKWTLILFFFFLWLSLECRHRFNEYYLYMKSWTNLQEIDCHSIQRAKQFFQLIRLSKALQMNLTIDQVNILIVCWRKKRHWISQLMFNVDSMLWKNSIQNKSKERGICTLSSQRINDS